MVMYFHIEDVKRENIEIDQRFDFRSIMVKMEEIRIDILVISRLTSLANNYNLVISDKSYRQQRDVLPGQKYIISFTIRNLYQTTLYAYWDPYIKEYIRVGIASDYIGDFPLSASMIDDEHHKRFPYEWNKQMICDFLNSLCCILPFREDQNFPSHLLQSF